MSYFTSFIEQIAGINSILEWNNLTLNYKQDCSYQGEALNVPTAF